MSDNSRFFDVFSIYVDPKKTCPFTKEDCSPRKCVFGFDEVAKEGKPFAQGCRILRSLIDIQEKSCNSGFSVVDPSKTLSMGPK